MIQPEREEDLPNDNPWLEIAVLGMNGYERRKRIIPTKVELTLEQSQEGVSDDVLVQREPPYPFDYPTRRLTMKEILDKFIDEGKLEHEVMEIFIKEFITTNEHLLKERSNLLSELMIEVNELSKVMSNVLIPKYEVNGVTTRGGKMTSEAAPSKEVNEIGINKNEPPRLEEACTETMNERCLAVLLNELPLKEKDPRSFTIPCQVLEKHKEVEDLAADNLSRFENPHMEVLTEREIADKFSDEHLMVLKSKFNNDEPWHHSANVTAKKVYESRFYWPSVFKDANEYLNELAKLRDGAYENTRIYKERTKKWHDSRLHDDKDFKVGDKVLLYNSRLRMYPGKLESNWSGPIIVKMVYPYGAIEIIDKNECNFKVNGQRLKKYYECDIDREDD
ncbi:hypothetical protein Tco_0172935 [Tanacetum coccineum]